MGSPQLVRKGDRWWLHTPIEKTFEAPAKSGEQLTTAQTRICAVDLNLDKHLAVCSVQTVDGTILATSFIGNGTAVSGCRKQLLGRIARNRSQTGMIAENEQDNADLWAKIRHVDEQIAHLVSSRIVQFATKHETSILVFEQSCQPATRAGHVFASGQYETGLLDEGSHFPLRKVQGVECRRYHHDPCESAQYEPGMPV